jgi:hypothetical protein
LQILLLLRILTSHKFSIRGLLYLSIYTHSIPDIKACINECMSALKLRTTPPIVEHSPEPCHVR